MPVTSAMLRDVVLCERRAWHDVHTAASLRDDVSGFVRMLWSGSVTHGRSTLAALPGAVADLRSADAADVRHATRQALASDR